MTMTNELFFGVSIAHGGFDHWQAGDPNGPPWADADDLVGQWADNGVRAVELTDEAVSAGLPEGLEDIRGRIHDEPGRVFGLQGEGEDHWTYRGIMRREYAPYSIEAVPLEDAQAWLNVIAQDGIDPDDAYTWAVVCESEDSEDEASERGLYGAMINKLGEAGLDSSTDRVLRVHSPSGRQVYTIVDCWKPEDL